MYIVKFLIGFFIISVVGLFLTVPFEIYPPSKAQLIYNSINSFVFVLIIILLSYFDKKINNSKFLKLIKSILKLTISITIIVILIIGNRFLESYFDNLEIYYWTTVMITIYPISYMIYIVILPNNTNK